MSSSQLASSQEDQHVLSAIRLRVSQLESDNKALRQQLQNTADDATNASERLEEYRKQAHNVVQQWMDTTSSVQQQLVESEKTCAALKAHVAELKRERDEVAKAHAQVLTGTARLQGQLQEAQERNSQLKEALQEVDSLRSAHQAASKSWETQKAELQRQHTHLEALVEQYKLQTAFAEKQAEECKQEFHSTKELLEDALVLAHKYKSDAVDVQSRSRAVSEIRHTEVADLQAALESHKQALEAASTKEGQYQERVAALEACLEATKDECGRLREEIVQAAEERASIEAASKMSDMTSQNLLDELRRSQEELQAIAAVEQQQRVDLQLLRESVVNHTNHLAELNTMNGSLESDIVEHQDTIQTMRRAIADLEASLSAAETFQVASISERDAIRQQLETLQTAHDALGSDLEQCRCNAAEQQNLFVELEGKWGTLNATVEDLRAELQVKEEDFNKLASKCVVAENNYFETRTKQDFAERLAEDRLVELKASRDAFESTRFALQSSSERCMFLEAAYKELELQYEELDERRDAETQLHDCELYVLRSNVQKLQSEEDRMATAHAAMKDALAASQADRDLYVAELGVARRMQSDLETMISTKIEQLQQEANDAIQLAEAKHDALVSSKQESEVLLRRLNETEDEVRLVKSRLGSATEDGRTLQAALTDAKRRLSEVSDARHTLQEQLQRSEQEVQALEQQLADSSARAAASAQSLEADLVSSRAATERLNQRLERLQESYKERTAKDKLAVDRYIESQATEREALVDKYNALYDGYKEMKRQSSQCSCGVFKGGNDSNNNNTDGRAEAASAAAVHEAKQALAEGLEKLRTMVERCHSQEHELRAMRHDNAVLHKVLETKLEGTNIVDVDRVLRDRSVTVHQLNVNEGPRRQPRRRHPSTLLGDGMMGRGVSTSVSSFADADENNHLISTAPLHRSSVALPMQQQPTNTAGAPHHMKIARRSAATALEEHNRPSMSVL